MSTGNDFYYTGGGFSDWSGGSAGRFSSSGGPSSGGTSGGGKHAVGDSKKPGPNDWKWGCGGALVVLAIIAVVIYFTCWDTIYYRWFWKPNDIEDVIDSIAREDSIRQAAFESSFAEDSVATQESVPSVPEAGKTKDKKVSTHKSHSSRYYSDDDEYDEDGMYKDEDEDIKDKRQYDSWDDDEADDWE